MLAGVIEGFFGNAWGFTARRDMAGFLSRAGYHFYLYAPKSDPWLRRRWREPLPDGLQAELSALATTCRSLGLAFGVGLTPFEVFLDYDAAAREQLRAKVRQLNELGCEMLCILFDDMRGEVPRLAQLQARIVTDITGWSDARRHLFCPTYYSFDPLLARVFGAPPPGYLEDIGRLIDPDIGMFWTGEEVCAREYSPAHLQRVGEQMCRKPVLWDNYPVNDGPRMSPYLFVRSVTGRPASIRPCLAAHAVNPALHGATVRLDSNSGILQVLRQSK